MCTVDMLCFLVAGPLPFAAPIRVRHVQYVLHLDSTADASPSVQRPLARAAARASAPSPSPQRTSLGCDPGCCMLYCTVYSSAAQRAACAGRGHTAKPERQAERCTPAVRLAGPPRRGRATRAGARGNCSCKAGCTCGAAPFAHAQTPALRACSQPQGRCLSATQIYNQISSSVCRARRKQQALSPQKQSPHFTIIAHTHIHTIYIYTKLQSTIQYRAAHAASLGQKI
jgi:hypothetical protein